MSRVYCYTQTICWFILQIDLELTSQHTLCRVTSSRALTVFNL